MHRISDKDLLEEIQRRFVDNKALVQKQQESLKQLQVLNKKLDESEAIKSHFLSNIRNEIINPFTSIMTLSKTILSATNLGEDKTKAMAGLIYKEAFMLDFQLRNIFEAAAIEAGELVQESSDTNILDLVTEVMQYMQHLCEEKKVRIVCQFSSSLKQMAVFRTDGEKVKSILINLLSNAVKYSPAEEKVTLKLAVVEKELHLTVKDLGIGIDEVSKNQLYDRFIRVNMKEYSHQNGHGLGLSIVKHLIDSMHGSIKVISRANFGSTFKVVIPETDMIDTGELFSEGTTFFISPETKF